MLHGKAKIYISSFTEQTTSVIQYSVKGRDEFVELYTRRFKEHKKLKKKNPSGSSQQVGCLQAWPRI